MKFIPGQFPFAVVFAIYVKGVGGGFKIFCGGTMVQDEPNAHISWAISAAHCFLDANMYVDDEISLVVSVEFLLT